MPWARFTILNAECIRIEYSRSGRWVDDPTLLAAYRSNAADHSELRSLIVDDVPGAAPAVIRTERFELQFSPRGTGLTPETLEVRLVHGGTWRPGSRQIGNLGGTLSTLDGVRGPEPLGEGLLSRDGWYLINDSKGHVLRDGWVRVRDTEPGDADWYLFVYGLDYRAALRAFAAVSGPVPTPRRALLGSWYSRYWPHTSAEFREIVAEYERHGLPLDVMVLDMDWHRDGWTGWSWNRELLPDAEDLLRWMHDRGLAVTLNLHPADGVGPHEDRYGDFMRALGRDPASGQTVPFDAGDQRYMTALFEQVHRPLEEEHGGGVDFWWVDWQQDKFVRSIPNLTNLQWLNRLYFEHTRRAPSSDQPPRRGVSFSRWAGDASEHRWGDHRHPIHFSGDAHTGWPMLRFQVPFTVTAGNVGCFFWSHDIGGHFGPRIEEATARWVQFGALSAALRLHSARIGVLDRRPWTYEPRFFESMRGAMRLRAELMPHLYGEVRRACRESVPLLRPMYLDHPQHARAYTCDRQYLLGASLLAAPITHAGVGARCIATQPVWFPLAAKEGHHASEPNVPGGWRRWDTGERYADGDEAIISAAIDEVPLFVREGVPTVLQPVGPRMTSGLGSRAIVRLWPPAVLHDSIVMRQVLEEDDGVTDDPLDQLAARTPLTATWARTDRGTCTLHLAIGPMAGEFAGMPSRRAWMLELAGVGRVHSHSGVVKLLPGDVQPDPHRLGGCVSVPLTLPEGQSVRDGVEVRLEFQPTDAEALDMHHASRRFCAAFDVQLDPQERTTASALRYAVLRLSRERASGHGRSNTRDAELRAGQVLEIGAGIGGWANDGVQVGASGGYRVCDTFGWLDHARVRAEVIDVIGTRTEHRGTGEFALAAGPRPAGQLVRSRAADIPLPAEPLASPALGVRARRLVRCEGAIDGQPIAWTSVVSERLTPVPASAWRVVGPFPWNWARSITDQVHSPEHRGGNGLDARDWHDAGDGAWVGWRKARAGERWPVDLRASLHVHNGLAYAMTTLTSSRRQLVRLAVESSDKLEIWVNRVKVFSQDGFETDAALAGGADVHLPQGRSVVLVKCASGGGGWGFSMSIDGEREVAADAEPEHVEHRAAPPSFG